MDYPRHVYWGAGEPDCPKEIKAPNGELHTIRCKVCGIDNPRSLICVAGQEPEIDWRALLVKYMAHVYDAEGSTSLIVSTPFLTDDEHMLLNGIEVEAVKAYKDFRDA